MFRPRNKPPLPIEKAKLPENSIETTANDGIAISTTTTTTTILYVPRQVFMSDVFDTTAKNNSSIASTSSEDQSTVITKKLNTMVIKKAKNHELQKSGSSRTWSPLMDDAIMTRKNLPACVNENCSSPSNGKTRKNSKIVTQKMVKLLDEYIDKILYAPSRRPLPIFEELCRE